MVEPTKTYEFQYTEGRKLGQGADGSVYEATHKQEKKKYAAKKLKIDLLPSDLD